MRYEFGGLIHGGAYFRNFTVSGMVFKGTTVGYERIYWNSKWILRNLFCCCSYLRNDDIISKRPGLRMGMDFRGQV